MLVALQKKPFIKPYILYGGVEFDVLEKSLLTNCLGI